mmetsp:Transcript_19299/g.46304  ORF Transcript_19299/g.46304 Transcript_19299/m.46304 type:complete len:1293 (+) Transcript_19299:334-4212(+)
MSHQPRKCGDSLVPLREWIEASAKEQISAQKTAGFQEKKYMDELILRTTTIAFGIAELLRHARRPSLDHPPTSHGGQCRIDNFVVRVAAASEKTSLPTRNDIKGVDMLSPPQSVNIVEPSFLQSVFFDEDQLGRYLEVELFPLSGADSRIDSCSQREKDVCCNLFGVLLYELYSYLSPLPAEGPSQITMINKRSGPSDPEESSKKKTRLTKDEDPAETTFPETASAAQEILNAHKQTHPALPVMELGIPASICLLTKNLLECGEENRPDEAYDSLDTVTRDLHLLLLDPIRFLFDRRPSLENERVELSFREHKLYGREKEVSAITDAFCRVSEGKSEAMIIDGYSGSGKSMLVDNLKARVDMAEGYVITYKFDQISKKGPLFGVISAFNDLCPLIRERSSKPDLQVLVKNLLDVFGANLSVLARLVPNIETLSPQLKLAALEKESGSQLNMRSICFTLQRFMRVVSSKSHPVLLFLDDLQWCDNSALAVVESILADVVGSGCLFFVGSYRSNEVQDSHAIFSLVANLRSSGVPITTISLEGLTQEDLSTMISDASGMFPRICKPLAEMVFQKTKGNPFFVLAFLRSLVDEDMLHFCEEKMRWVWDKEGIRSMDITGNVLYLLSSKMNGLSENIQLTLKVAACFGIKITDYVVGHLSTSSEYSAIRDGLAHAIKEGFMVGLPDEFKFVHDKVREAAYGLIPESEKSQYHYKLGMLLHSRTKGKDVGALIFYTADHINHGINSLPVECPELRVDFAKVNEMAGVKAVECTDYVAACSYLSTALSLLPTDHWQRYYDQSLRLLFLSAKSSYSCGDVEGAQDILGEILDHCVCLEDKLDSYFLLVTIRNVRGHIKDAYSLCHGVLSQFGEVIPSSLDPKQTFKMIEETSIIVNNLSDTDLLEMKEADEKLCISLKFYNLIVNVALFARPDMAAFLACKMVQLTMKHGICQWSLFGLVQFAAMLNDSRMAKGIWDGLSFSGDASRIGRAAISCWKKRFQTTEQLPIIYAAYYGRVAYQTESFQSCADMLQQGFDAGMSLGQSGAAFTNAVHHVTYSLWSSEKLSTLLEKADYYLDLMTLYKNDLAKIYMSLLRDTVSQLIDKSAGSSKINSSDATENISEVIYLHQAYQAYWSGHSERCHHYFEKVLRTGSPIRKPIIRAILFLYGLNSFQVLKRQNSAKIRSISSNVITILKTAALHSRWNFRNKVHLLEAEFFSLEGRDEDAKHSYAAAITSARCSRFIHEQGLACELAGCHYKKIGDHKCARAFFDRAKQHYSEWGSQMKVDSITRQLESVKPD